MPDDNIHKVLKSLRRENASGAVRFVKMNGMGPMTVHPTGPLETSTPAAQDESSDTPISPAESKR